MSNINLIEKMKSFLRKMPNLWRATPVSTKPFSENNFIAANLSVDRLHQIISNAQQGDCGDLFDLYRDIIAADAHIQSEFGKRKIRLLGEQISVLPSDPKNDADVMAADATREMLDSIPDRIRILSYMMDSCLYPVSVLEKVFKPSNKARLSYELAEIIPVPHRLLDFSQGGVRIFECDDSGFKSCQSYLADKNKFIIHRNHILSSPDYWGGPMRAILFWWLISAMDLAWWSQWLERYGMPFLIGKYDSNDDESRYVLQQAFSMAARIGRLVATKETEIDFINALVSQNGEAFEKLLQTCHREESKLILGQTLSSEAQPTGLGSGVAESHENVRSDIALFDMNCVATSLKEQLVKPFLEFNGFTGRTPKIIIGGESETDLQGLAAMLSALNQSGLQIGDDGLAIISQRCGFPVERIKNNLAKMFSAKIPTEKKDRILACKEIARNTSAELAPKFHHSADAILQMLNESESPEDFEKSVEAFCSKWPDADITAIIQDVLTANLINGVSSNEE